MDRRGIGVFDSGLGGLTVVKELRKIMPYEDIVYFGDTARLPYGTRGRDVLFSYIKQSIRFLYEKDVKAIIVACGTASSVLVGHVGPEMPLPFWTVIPAASQAAVEATVNCRVGVIGTSATIKSDAFGREIGKLAPMIRVKGVACPLFVNLVENGYVGRDNEVTRMVARDYLSAFEGFGIDTLILGCTHFPLIADIVGDIMGEKVTLIDSGRETAKFVAAELREKGLLNDQQRHGNVSYYVSDKNMGEFSMIGSIFMEEHIQGFVRHVDINQY